MLWDTAGQEEFDALTKAYYRGNQITICLLGIISVYHCTDYDDYFTLQE